MIVIIDYGAGNLESIKNALNKLKIKYIVSSNPKDIRLATKIIFPGVGSFGSIINNLKEKGLFDVLKKEILLGKPYLGICLGLQILFENSEEFEGVKGFSILKGKVKKFKLGIVPHIGWNKLNIKNDNFNLFSNEFVYFVHSYYVVPEDEDIISTTTNYNIDYCSSIEFKNIIAVQFHPEKSGSYGLKFLENWANN